ncbi:hypothetical protein CDAR_209811 [Caerostris darwini]|uniref:Secreted protein n=1 Tax=Caerostris darwini TaxID=1538125 RepID=A0AAV4PCW1_9ARAC|nr:hypothetical protein CDAR_209811 [Caerostris darwini]
MTHEGLLVARNGRRLLVAWLLLPARSNDLVQRLSVTASPLTESSIILNHQWMFRCQRKNNSLFPKHAAETAREQGSSVVEPHATGRGEPFNKTLESRGSRETTAEIKRKKKEDSALTLQISTKRFGGKY